MEFYAGDRVIYTGKHPDKFKKTDSYVGKIGSINSKTNTSRYIINWDNKGLETYMHIFPENLKLLEQDWDE